jgi:hypothetical protein
MQLSLGKRLESGGKMPWVRAIRRILGLALVAIVWYTFCEWSGIVKDFQTRPATQVLLKLYKDDYSQTLMHIAVTSLWILPVITMNWKIRLAYAVFSGLLHFLISWWFNFVWVHSDPGGVDGGPLGFLSWAVPALCGTLACDAVRRSGTQAALRIALCGVGVMVVGWLMSFGTVLYNVHGEPPLTEASSPDEIATAKAKSSGLNPVRFPPDPVVPTWDRLRTWDGTIVELPFVPPPDDKHRQWNYWMMSQRGGNLSYPTFCAGLSLVIYSLFLWACDGKKWQLGIFRTLGTNSLAAYLLHDVAGWLIKDHYPSDSTSVVMTMAVFALYTFFVYSICRLLEWLGWYIRV